MLEWKLSFVFVLSSVVLWVLPLVVTANTKCQQQLEDAKSLIESGVVDIRLPVCMADGSFAPKQCNFQGCFCVDERTGVCKGGTKCQPIGPDEGCVKHKQDS